MKLILKKNLIYFPLILIFLLNLTNCSKVRDSAGVSRKSFDEYNVIENPPLVIPPDFNLSSNNQLKEKNINNTENELAQEILFGLDDEISNQEIKSSTMDTILQNANALDNNSNIREDIDEIISNKKSTKGLLDQNWEDENAILDAVKESERIRDQTFDNDLIIKEEIPIKKDDTKKKKKKKFLFF